METVSQNPTPPVSDASKTSLGRDWHHGRSSPLPASLPSSQEDAKELYEMLGEVEDRLEVVLPLMRQHDPPPIVGRIKRRWGRIQGRVSTKRVRRENGKGKRREEDSLPNAEDGRDGGGGLEEEGYGPEGDNGDADDGDEGVNGGNDGEPEGRTGDEGEKDGASLQPLVS
jgi:hypothetical protein